jgi:molybdopterin synthase sulfur carrier subunit
VVTILFFAQLREQLQCEKLSLEIKAPMTLSEVRDEILHQYPHWAPFLNSDKLLFAINQTLAKSSQLVRGDDEVAFFPPVTGG